MKREKYTDISATHHFVALGIETSGVFGMEAKELLLEVVHQVMEESEDPKSYDYLLQRIFVAIQRGNAEPVLGTSVSLGTILTLLYSRLLSSGREGFVFKFCLLF